MRVLKACAVVTSAMFCVLGLWAAQQSTPAAAPKIEVSRLGPQVGDWVPDFSLRDQNGRTQTLQSIMGAKGAMLVFVRSADW
jgi:hypothetical protein